MTSKDRVKTVLDHREPDRVPVYDAPWGSTIERWKKEGLPRDVVVEDHFDYDIKVFLPDTTLHFPYKIIEETDEYIVERNNFGEVVKNFKNRSTTPQILDTPIKTRKEWEKHKDRLKMFYTRGLSADTALNFSETLSFKDGLDIYKKYEYQQKYLIFGAFVGFDLVQRYVGTERLLMAFIDDPVWVKEMFTESAKFVLEVFDYMIEMGYRFDAAWIFDDLGYRNTTLMSPAHYKDLIFRADKFVCDFFHKKGLKVLLHSCGCVKDLIPYFIEAGIDCLQPLQVKAGMDLIELKRIYGNKISFMGGIDTRLYSEVNDQLVEEEIRLKLKEAKRGGGYIYHCDHSIPHTVSLSQYQKILQLIRKYGTY